MENGISTPGRKIVELSWRLLTISHRNEQHFGRKTTEKSENFLVWNTASMKSPELSRTDRFLAVLSNLGKSSSRKRAASTTQVYNA